MAFFRYALLDVLRGHRRTFSSILGVLLAITFLSGTFIAIDSSARATLEGVLQGVRGDFRLTVRDGGDPLQLRNALLANPEVVNASVYVDTVGIAAYWVDAETGEPLTRSLDLQAVDPERLPVALQRIEVVGPFDLTNGTVALSSGFASDLDLGLNDTLTLRGSFGEGWGNVTVRALVTDPEARGLPPFQPDPLALVHIRDVQWFLQQLGFPASFSSSHAEVWIDRGRFINPYDIEESQRRLTRFERDLVTDLRQEGFSQVDILDNVSNRLSIYENQVSMQRVVYLLLSLPVLLLGLYLGAVGVDLGHAERRRELAVLKARGANGTQVLGLLILGAVLGGLLATVLGLLAGVALSRLLLSVVNPFALSVAPALGDLVLQPDTVFYVTLFSVGFMLLASYRSAKRTAGLPVAETLRHYAPGETKIAYRPTVDAVLVGLGTLALVGTWYVRVHTGTFVTFLVGIVFIVLLPLAPVFLIVGITRLLTRSTGKIYEWAARLWKPVTGNLYAVISRTLSRNPRRSASVAVIIALGLAFGMFIFAFLGSTMAYTTRTLRAEIGADLRVESPPAGDAGFAANVSQVDGVTGVSPVVSFSARMYGSFVDVYAVDPATHFAVTQPEGWWFDGLSTGTAAEVLQTRGAVLASQRLADEIYLEAGDRVPLVSTAYDPVAEEGVRVEVEVTVGGVVRGLPGTARSGFSLPRALYGSFETLAPLFSTEAVGGIEIPRQFADPHLLVDLEPGADWEEVEAAVQELGGSSVRVYEERLQQRANDPVFRSILGFIGLEVAFIVVIITAGLGLILFAATLERDVEFAAIRARGASAWQTAGLLVGEATGVLLVGLAVGVSVGLLVAYFVLQVTVLAAPGGLGPLVPFLFELAPQGWVLVVLAPAALLGTALLIALRVAHMNVARVLKIRGG